MINKIRNICFEEPFWDECGNKYPYYRKNNLKRLNRKRFIKRYLKQLDNLSFKNQIL